MAQDAKAGGVVMTPQPCIRLSAGMNSFASSMTSAIVLDMVNRQERFVRLSTARTLIAIGRECHRPLPKLIGSGYRSGSYGITTAPVSKIRRRHTRPMWHIAIVSWGMHKGTEWLTGA
jgi:hypothetical protein